MLVIAAAVALVAPSLRGWGRGAALRDAADQFAAMARRAAAQAAAEARTYHLEIDETGAYRAQAWNGQTLVDVNAGWAREVRLPDDVRIEWPDSGNNGLDFFPTGRCTATTVRFLSPLGGIVSVTCPSPAEGYVVVVGETP